MWSAFSLLLLSHDSYFMKFLFFRALVANVNFYLWILQGCKVRRVKTRSSIHHIREFARIWFFCVLKLLNLLGSAAKTDWFPVIVQAARFNRVLQCFKGGPRKTSGCSSTGSCETRLVFGMRSKMCNFLVLPICFIARIQNSTSSPMLMSTGIDVDFGSVLSSCSCSLCIFCKFRAYSL